MKPSYLLFLLLTLSSQAFAQKSESFDVIFNHVALSVKDVDRAADFYSEVLHLKEIRNETRNPDIRWFSLGEGKELHLISSVKKRFKINKAIHFAITISNYDAFVANLEANGITYSSWLGEEGKVSLRPDGIRQVYVRDPDGHWIEINSVAAKK
ncbi:MAG TPA: VOC family protein [Saprospiraceae bacterium]|nr:VOC family protein [Saprospiraceae bacterium]